MRVSWVEFERFAVVGDRELGLTGFHVRFRQTVPHIC